MILQFILLVGAFPAGIWASCRQCTHVGIREGRIQTNLTNNTISMAKHQEEFHAAAPAKMMANKAAEICILLLTLYLVS